MITKEAILTDIINICVPYLVDLSGRINKYKRPLNSKKEDTVVNLIGNVTAKFENFNTLQITIFCPDIQTGKQYVPNSIRLGVHQELLYSLSEAIKRSSNYQVILSTRTIESFSVVDNDVHQHQSVLSMSIKNLIS